MALDKIAHMLTKSLRVLICLGALAFALTAYAENIQLYRYINSDGIKVLDSRIPPEYAQKGYEIISTTGKILKVVPPAPTAEEIAKSDTQKEILFHYEMLSKRYSSIDSIEAARKRRLSNLETSISILNGNVSSLSNQLENQMSAAADREREGKTIPKTLLNQIANSKAELAVAKELLEIRIKEKDEVNKKFDKDIEYFVKGQAIAQKKIEPNTVPN